MAEGLVAKLPGRRPAWAGAMRRLYGPSGCPYTAGRGPKDAARATVKTRPTMSKKLTTRNESTSLACGAFKSLSTRARAAVHAHDRT